MRPLLPLLAALLLAAPLQAQAVRIQNGATVTVGDGATLQLGVGYALDESGGTLTASGASTTTASATLTAPSNADVGGLGFVISSAADPGETTVVRGHAPQSNGTGAGIERYYDVTAATSTGLDATVTFHYREAELNGAAEVDLQMFRSTDGGTTWTSLGGTVDAAANTVTVSGLDGFSRFTLASSTALPVELVSLQGRADGRAVTLAWETASETANAGFAVEHRAPGATAFAEVGWVAGAGTTPEGRRYSFRAEPPGGLAFGAHAFRLRQVDLDGTATLSPEVEATVALGERAVLEAAYPNPATRAATVAFAVREAEPVTLELFDGLGRRVAVLYAGTPPAGTSERVRLDAGALAAGAYVLRLQGAGFTRTERLTVVR